MSERKNEAKWVESRQRWQINVQKDSVRRTFTSTKTGPKGKIAAEKQADKWLESGLNKDVRLNTLYADFLVDMKNRTGTANYYKHESIGRVWLLPRLGHKRISTITTNDWQGVINAAFKEGAPSKKRPSKKGLAKKSLKNIRASIAAVYSFALKGRMPMFPPGKIVIPRNAPVIGKIILQPDGLKTLFTESEVTLYRKPVRAFFVHAWRFIVLTGLRPGELAGLQREDIAGDCLAIKRAINQQGEETQGKNDNAPRVMRLSQYALKVLANQRDELKASGIISPWVFPDEKGGRLSTTHLYAKWLTYSKQHGIKSTPYGMRHTMISIAKADVPEALLKRIVGHSENMETVGGPYDHEVDGDMERAAGYLNAVFGRYLDDVFK